MTGLILKKENNTMYNQILNTARGDFYNKSMQLRYIIVSEYFLVRFGSLNIIHGI